MTTYVFDMDGTLSLPGDRVKFLKETPPNWDAFYSACDQDKVNEPVWELFKLLMANRLQAPIFILTGRREEERQKTLQWLVDNQCYFNGNHLLMRPKGDKRPDTVVKPELLSGAGIPSNAVIFEDRASVVQEWRKRGFTCLQVAEGNF